jgi:hypothetical protein
MNQTILPILLLLIMLAGLVMAVFGAVRILISAFRKSIVWGLGCLFVPFCKLIYIIVDWEEAKSGFFLYLKGVGVIILGGVMVVVMAPNHNAVGAMQRVHARERAPASPSVKEQSAPSPTDKSHPFANLFQKKQPAASPSHPALHLQGISYHPTRPSAIINNNTLFVGEKVADWTVTAISNQSVTLQDNTGQTNILSLR